MAIDFIIKEDGVKIESNTRLLAKIEIDHIIKVYKNKKTIVIVEYYKSIEALDENIYEEYQVHIPESIKEYILGLWMIAKMTE